MAEYPRRSPRNFFDQEHPLEPTSRKRDLQKAEKTSFTSIAIACKEGRESYYWLRLLAASEVVSKDRLEPLIVEANELIAILTTIIKKSRE